MSQVSQVFNCLYKYIYVVLLKFSHEIYFVLLVTADIISGNAGRGGIVLLKPPCLLYFQRDRLRCSSVIEQVQLQVSEASDGMG